MGAAVERGSWSCGEGGEGEILGRGCGEGGEGEILGRGCGEGGEGEMLGWGCGEGGEGEILGRGWGEAWGVRSSQSLALSSCSSCTFLN